MKNENTNENKLIILMFFLVILSAFTAWHSIGRKRDMKGKIKELYSVVIKEQVHDSLPYDSVKNSIERFKDIDSSGYTHDASVIDFIIDDYKRLSGENKKLKDSVLNK